jgi:hypothetical protein
MIPSRGPFSDPPSIDGGSSIDGGLNLRGSTTLWTDRDPLIVYEDGVVYLQDVAIVPNHLGERWIRRHMRWLRIRNWLLFWRRR